MGEDLLRHIIDEIGKSGFPLEMRIAKLLNEREYIVNHSAYYLDIDEHKSREIDIVAHMNRTFIAKDTNKEVFAKKCIGN